MIFSVVSLRRQNRWKIAFVAAAWYWPEQWLFVWKQWKKTLSVCLYLYNYLSNILSQNNFQSFYFFFTSIFKIILLSSPVTTTANSDSRSWSAAATTTTTATTTSPSSGDYACPSVDCSSCPATKSERPASHTSPATQLVWDTTICSEFLNAWIREKTWELHTVKRRT